MKVKGVQLTEDPLTNIHIMVPLLDEEGRKAIANMMFGYCLGETLKKDSNDKKEQSNEDSSLSV